MYFENLQAILYMDGHGPFVWAAYGITFAVILTMLMLPGRRSRAQLRQLTGELRRQQGTPTAREEN